MQPVLPHIHIGLPAMGTLWVSIRQLAMSVRAASYLAAIVPAPMQGTDKRPSQMRFVTVSAVAPYDSTGIRL